MTRIRHTNLTSSAFVAAMTLLSLVFLNTYDLVLMTLGFVFLQMLMVLISATLILLRIFSFMKNRNAWLYYFCGTTQAGLCLTDIYLLLYHQEIIKNGVLIFLGLNGLLSTIIFYDIYKPSYVNGNSAGVPASPVLIE